MRKLIFSLLLLIVLNGSAQTLSADEKRIVDYIHRNHAASIQLLKEMVNINSGTLNVEGVRKVGAILRNKFDSIGFTTEWISFPDSVKRGGHLVASMKGNKGKKLFLIGHLDTVFEPDMPANPFRMLNDSTATGQGVNDMKGGDVVVWAALQSLQHLGLIKNASIIAYFTGDEENAGHPRTLTRSDFIERAKQCDIALGFEGAQGLNTVATARRGASSWQLKVYGRQAHSSGVFGNNYGAIYEAARILDTFRRELSNEKYLTFNPGTFAGGAEISDGAGIITVSGKTNIIAPSAIVNGDLRFLSEAQKSAARTKMKSFATSNNLPGTRAEITFSDGIPSMEPTTGNERLVLLLSKLTKDMGIGETKAGDPGGRGAGDISYVAQYVDCLDGLGASGKGAHAPGETINLNEYQKLIERAAIFIYRLTR